MQSVHILQGPWFRVDADIQPLQQADLTGYGISTEQALTTLHVVDGQRTYRGAAAIARLLRSSRFPWPLAGIAMTWPGIRWVAERSYQAVARNRHRLPGGTDTCTL